MKFYETTVKLDKCLTAVKSPSADGNIRKCLRADAGPETKSVRRTPHGYEKYARLPRVCSSKHRLAVNRGRRWHHYLLVFHLINRF